MKILRHFDYYMESLYKHKVFQKRTIADKPKKTEVVKDMEKFIKQAEDKL